MIESPIKLVANFARAVAVIGLLLFFHALSNAQSVQRTTPILPTDKDRTSPDSPASLEEEMRVKHAIKGVEKEYQQNVDRARDLFVLGQAMNTSFKQKTFFGRDDIKKLGKAEKLAKAIRSAAGGSEDDNEMEQPPKDLACALSKFAEVAESLKKKVEATPKHVISAAVIDEANVILELARIVRTLIPNP